MPTTSIDGPTFTTVDIDSDDNIDPANVVVEATGVVTPLSGVGVLSEGPYAPSNELTNEGTIAGASGSAGIDFSAGGAVENHGKLYGSSFTPSIVGGAGADGAVIGSLGSLDNEGGNITGGMGADGLDLTIGLKSSSNSGAITGGVDGGTGAVIRGGGSYGFFDNGFGGTISGGDGATTGVGGVGAKIAASSDNNGINNGTINNGTMKGGNGLMTGGSGAVVSASMDNAGFYYGPGDIEGGLIEGGMGIGAGSTGGAGVVFTAASTFTNEFTGTIQGGDGVAQGGAGVIGSQGVSMTSAGTIMGGDPDTGTGGVGFILNGATVDNTGTIEGGSGAGGVQAQAVSFGSGSGTLIEESSGTLSGHIGDFVAGDEVRLTGATSVTQTTNDDGSVTLTDETSKYGSQSITFDDAAGEGISTTVVRDSQGNVTEIDVTAAACYHRGTRIRTPLGDVPIEALKVGEEVITATGESRAVRWLGSRRIDCRRYVDPSVVWPIRIEAEALAPGVPQRDLWVSPGHSLYLEGVLIQAEKLVNGATILRVPQARVEYWHVELESHDLVLAEGAPSESYLDTGNRTAFENGGAYLEAHPDFKPKHWRETCVPLVIEGEPLVRARTQVLERAKALGYAITHETDLHVMADGERIDPMELGDGRWAFCIPATRQRLELCSRSFIPIGVDPSSRDGRNLGVCVDRLQIDGAEVPLGEDHRYSHGWHALEVYPGGHRQRWTCGRASLPVGARLVVIGIAGPSCCWRRPEAAPAGVCRLRPAVQTLESGNEALRRPM